MTSWRFSGRWSALTLLTVINLLNYLDRNIFSALLPAIKADLGLSDTQLGFLGSGFIFAYLVVSPLFGWWGDKYSRPKIMAVGTFFWSIATAFTGLARTFTTQMLARVAVGVGEAAYSVISPSIIADHFPKSLRGRALAVYGAALPIGSALGYIAGGLLEGYVGWHGAFFVVGIPGVIVALSLWWMIDPKRGANDENSSASDVTTSHFKTLLGELARNHVFVFVVLGYAAYTFVVGGVGFWMPSYIVRFYQGVSLMQANTVFGALTVIGGFFGTLLGGWLGDYLERHGGNGYMRVCVLSMILSVPLFVWLLNVDQFLWFCILLVVLEIILFMCISPLDAAVLNCVRPTTRAMAMAVNVFLIHALGDGISRALIGRLSDIYGLRVAVYAFPGVLALAGVLWLICPSRRVSRAN